MTTIGIVGAGTMGAEIALVAALAEMDVLLADADLVRAEPVVAAVYYAAAMDEARRLADEGVASPTDIDLAMRLGAGWQEGPLAAG